MKRLFFSMTACVGILLLTGAACAQVSVMKPGQDVKIGKDGTVIVRSDSAASASGRNEARVSVGEISSEADVEGITVINGRVSIDGKDVPSSISRYKSPKTGRVYLIQRRGGSVSVSEMGDANERAP